MNRPYRFLLTLTFALGVILAASTQAQSTKLDLANGAISGFFGQTATPVGQPFDLDQGSLLGGPPPNNLCSEAVIVPLAAGVSEVRTGDNTGATDELGFGVGQAWEAFTTTECLDVTIAYCGTDPVHQGVFNFLAVGCPLENFAFTGDGSIEQSSCGDGNFTLTFPELPAGTYYYPVLTAPGATGPYTVTFSAVACTAIPPVNDECSGATVLIPNPDCITTTGNVAGANAGVSLPAITCAGFTGDASDDVWYTFVATATAHTIVVQGSAEFDPTVDFRSGTCGETNTIACSDATGRGGVETLNATGLNIGQTYFVRVNDWYAGLPLTTTFTICVLGPDPGTCAADAGTLAPASTTTCLEDGSVDLVATPSGNANVPAGFETVFVLTQGNGLVIIGTSASPSFTITEAGNYTIHTLVFDPTTLDLSIVEPGVTTGFDVNALLEQGGGNICASLDVSGSAFIVLEDCSSICPADAGTLTANTANVCIEDGQAILLATPAGDVVVPAGYEVLYVLTQGEDLVIVNAESAPFFGVSTPGTYTIHTLVYDPSTLDLSLVQLGTTTGFDVNALLIQGGGDICASLDVAGAAFTVEICAEPCDADAGTMSADDEVVCLVDGLANISATANGDAIVPEGFIQVFALTQGPTFVIIQGEDFPVFEVDEVGTYTIHSFVVDPVAFDLESVEFGVTTASEVVAQITQGGGGICSSLDVTGATITVEICAAPCDADAGTLSGGNTVCLENDAATLTATTDGNGNLPDGYSTVYVLTEGAGLVIVQAGATPEFTVDSEGDYTIHTLVYDPNTLDLGIVEFGITTGFDVNGLLIQGGGDICASLDVAGAAFIVLEDCSSICPADAGTITANTANVCIENGQAILLATPGGDIVVPAGYQVLYVLTQGEDLVIVNAESAPFFGVGTPGTYTIHTFVYDPNTLDLSLVELGTTTGFDVNGLLIQGGGAICASLDVAGAAFSVEICAEPCDSDAGTLSGGATVCLENNEATLTATADGNSNVPDGYSTVYVLTEGAGLVIVQAGATPEFTVAAEGSYTIHTLVYDENTLDLGIVELGATTGFEVNGLLIQGGGDICASLDVAGAAFSVEDCTPSNDACSDAILIPINQSCVPVAGDNTYSTENNNDPSCDNSTVGYADVWYRFSSGGNSTLDILLEPGTMTDWGIVVTEGCSGEEILCEVQPNGSITFDVLNDTEYTIRVFSNLQFGDAGNFEICLVGAIPSVNCEAGSISTTFGTTLENVCQDGEADVITFSTTSASDQNYTYIVTDEAGSILTPLAGNALDFNGAPLGTYRVWGISFNGTLQGATPGANIADVSATGTCVERTIDFVTVNVEICTGIDALAGASWNLQPNPSNGDFTLIPSITSDRVLVDVLDMGGRLAHSEQISMVQGEAYTMQLAGRLVPGVYMLRLSTTGTSTTLRMVVQ